MAVSAEAHTSLHVRLACMVPRQVARCMTGVGGEPGEGDLAGETDQWCLWLLRAQGERGKRGRELEIITCYRHEEVREGVMMFCLGSYIIANRLCL